DADVLAPVLQQVADARPDGRLLLLGSADATVKAIIRVRDEIGLDERYIAPYISLDTFVAATEKQNFTRLCQQLGVDHPGTVVVDLAEEIPGDLEIPFEFPVIAKPAEVSEWKRIQFPGQNKVHTVASREDLLELLRTIRGAGYRESIIVQDRIPGDDQEMRILTVYCDQESRVRFASWGCTLPGRSAIRPRSSPVWTGIWSRRPSGCAPSWAGPGTPTSTSSTTGVMVAPSSSSSIPAWAAPTTTSPPGATTPSPGTSTSTCGGPCRRRGRARGSGRTASSRNSPRCSTPWSRSPSSSA